MDKYYDEADTVIGQVKRVVIGKDACIQKAMAAILAGGHILIEDIPGVGKTTLARAFSKAMDLESRRIQFTPDVMPADLTGFSMYRKKEDQFVYQPGAVMCNLFLGDEINRTSPKTQSALLEVMEEGSATVDGITRKVPKPFIVIATQNPAGSIGTQKLPESQLDRFMICMTMGYPELEDEIRIAKGKSLGADVETITPVISASELITLQEKTADVFVEDSMYHYICSLVQASRQNGYIALGLSPRATLAVVNMAKATAFLHHRDFIVPEDVAEIFVDATAHRIVLNAKARAGHMSAVDVLNDLLQKEKKPVIRRK